MTIRPVHSRSLVAASALAALLAVGCDRRAEEPATDEEPTKPKVEAPAPEPVAPEPAVNPALLNASLPGQGGERTLPRFRAQYLAEKAITEDAELIAQINALTDPDKAKGIYEAIKDRSGLLPVLHKAMWHRDPNVRSNVAKILVLLDDHSKATTDAMVSVLLHDADGDVRGNVARALVTYKHKDTVVPLITVLGTDPRMAARDNAAWALGQIGDKRAIEPLMQALMDDETRVRLRAVGALKRLGAKQAAPAIVERVKDSNQVVRERAVETLQALTGKKIGEDYDRWKKAVKR